MKHVLNKYSHKVGLNYWHFEWATKYRFEMMRKEENRQLVKEIVLQVCEEYDIQVHEIEVLPDHVHLLVSLPRGMTDEKAFGLMKGRSAYLIFRAKPNYRLRYPKGHFWSSGGFAVTVGYNDYDRTSGYIKKQLSHHGIV